MTPQERADGIVRFMLDNPDLFMTKDTSGIARFAKRIGLAIDDAEVRGRKAGMEEAAGLFDNGSCSPPQYFAANGDSCCLSYRVMGVLAACIREGIRPTHDEPEQSQHDNKDSSAPQDKAGSARQYEQRGDAEDRGVAYMGMQGVAPLKADSSAAPSTISEAVQDPCGCGRGLNHAWTKIHETDGVPYCDLCGYYFNPLTKAAEPACNHEWRPLSPETKACRLCGHAEASSRDTSGG